MPFNSTFQPQHLEWAKVRGEGGNKLRLEQSCVGLGPKTTGEMQEELPGEVGSQRKDWRDL